MSLLPAKVQAEHLPARAQQGTRRVAGLQQPTERSVPTIQGTCSRSQPSSNAMDTPLLPCGLRAGDRAKARRDQSREEGPCSPHHWPPSQEPGTWSSGAPCWPSGACVTLGWGGAAQAQGCCWDPQRHPRPRGAPTQKHTFHTSKQACAYGQSHVCLDVQIRAPVFQQRGDTMHVSTDRHVHSRRCPRRCAGPPAKPRPPSHHLGEEGPRLLPLHTAALRGQAELTLWCGFPRASGRTSAPPAHGTPPPAHSLPSPVAWGSGLQGRGGSRVPLRLEDKG